MRINRSEGERRRKGQVFNSRLQPDQIALGTVQGGTNKLKLDYSYGNWTTGGTIDESKNNGNIVQQVITVPDAGTVGLNGFTATQKYYYDELNRIDDATEHVGTSQKWRQDFTYDRYGNRRFDLSAGHTTTPLPNCVEAICNPTISTSNNRITSANWLYDNAGNTTRDGDYKTFTYDGENKQVEVKNSSNVSLGQYFYDGDGKRVKKVVPATSETTHFIYDASGKLIEEYSTNVATLQTAEVAYLTNDHLGSPRINTDRDGDVTSRHDYHPFGEEILTTERGNHPDYTPDSVRKQFTGYERDGEIELDFAQARYYSRIIGRFISVDRIMIEFRRVLDPQGINRYIYARNNPLLYIDPSGKTYVGTDGKGVKVEIDKNGKIKLGKNATDDLKRLADLVSKSGSAKALALFRAGSESKTRFNIVIHPESDRKDDTSGTMRPHNANGQPVSSVQKEDPEYVQDPKTGKLVYKEATIDLWEYGDGTKEYYNLWLLRATNNDQEITQEDALVAVLGHEIHHGTDSEDINIVRGVRWGYLISNGRGKNYPGVSNQDGGTEDKAWRVSREILGEIKAVRNVTKSK